MTDFSLIYKNEESDDKLLQNILIFCENITEHEINKDLEDLIGYYVYFCDKKINYLEDLQHSFELPNNKKRFEDISKYLDGFTLGESQHNSMSDFGIKISSLLDLLYSVELLLKNFYNFNFYNQ